MPFNGLRSLTLSFFLFIFMSSILAEDFGIAMPDQLKENSIKDIEESESVFGNHLMGDSKEGVDSWKAADSEDFAFSKEKVLDAKEVSKREKAMSNGSGTPFSLENRDQILVNKNGDIFNNVYSQGQSSFSFSYIQDSYDVKDAGGVFERSFNADKGTLRGGSIHLFFDSYLTKGFISPFWGGGFGVGYSQGKGIFSQSVAQESNVRFQLFTVPLDLRLGADIGRGKYFKLSVAAGPSIVGLLQSRSDKERDDRGEDGKYRRQVGFGYFGHAKAQISVSAISSSIAFDTYSQYDMTNMYFNLEARFQNYENFQDEISINGLSLGIGFSFEYL